MKTTTYTYRLYQFENGLGETVYQAKYRGGFWHLWGWTWFWGSYPLDDQPRQWFSRDGAIGWLRERSQRVHEEAQQNLAAAKRTQLKLVVIEPVKIEL